MNLSELIQAVREYPERVVVPASWGQGRAGFGGLAAALVYEAMRARVPADRPVRSLADVDRSDRRAWARLFHLLLERGVHLPPSPYETLFVSTAHGSAEIDATLQAFDDSLALLARE